MSSTKFRLISKGHTSTAPVDCGIRAAVCSARKVGKWLKSCDLSGGQRGDTLPLGKLDGGRRCVCQQSRKECREDESFVQHLDVGSRGNTGILKQSACQSVHQKGPGKRRTMCVLFGGCHMRRSFGSSEQEAASEYC